MNSEMLEDFYRQQLQSWSECAARFYALDNIISKELDIDGFKVTVTHNPARIRSSAAKVDKSSIDARPCFLCDKNRPQQQRHIDWKDYKILVNPFPILHHHFTIVANQHRPQCINGAIDDMVELSKALPGYAIFYNGPRCGASAPDHFHFQAVKKAGLPLLNGSNAPFKTFTLSGELANQRNVDDILANLHREDDEQEPKVNIFCTTDNGIPTLTIIPRRKHRPDFYGEDGMLISPASLDLAGVFVAPRRCDYDNFTPEVIKDIYHQLCY